MFHLFRLFHLFHRSGLSGCGTGYALWFVRVSIIRVSIIDVIGQIVVGSVICFGVLFFLANASHTSFGGAIWFVLCVVLCAVGVTHIVTYLLADWQNYKVPTRQSVCTLA